MLDCVFVGDNVPVLVSVGVPDTPRLGVAVRVGVGADVADVV
jgi:hypothetical protein